MSQEVFSATSFGSVRVTGAEFCVIFRGGLCAAGQRVLGAAGQCRQGDGIFIGECRSGAWRM